MEEAAAAAAARVSVSIVPSVKKATAEGTESAAEAAEAAAMETEGAGAAAARVSASVVPSVEKAATAEAAEAAEAMETEGAAAAAAGAPASTVPSVEKAEVEGEATVKAAAMETEGVGATAAAKAAKAAETTTTTTTEKAAAAAAAAAAIGSTVDKLEEIETRIASITDADARCEITRVLASEQVAARFAVVFSGGTPAEKLKRVRALAHFFLVVEAVCTFFVDDSFSSAVSLLDPKERDDDHRDLLWLALLYTAEIRDETTQRGATTKQAFADVVGNLFQDFPLPATASGGAAGGAPGAARGAMGATAAGGAAGAAGATGASAAAPAAPSTAAAAASSRPRAFPRHLQLALTLTFFPDRIDFEDVKSGAAPKNRNEALRWIMASGVLASDPLERNFFAAFAALAPGSLLRLRDFVSYAGEVCCLDAVALGLHAEAVVLDDFEGEEAEEVKRNAIAAYKNADVGLLRPGLGSAACCASAVIINGQQKGREAFKAKAQTPAATMMASELGPRGYGRTAASFINTSPASPVGSGFHGNAVAVPVGGDTRIPWGYKVGGKLFFFRPNANTASLLTIEVADGSSSSSGSGGGGEGSGGSGGSGSGGSGGSGGGGGGEGTRGGGEESGGDASQRFFLINTSIYFTPGGTDKQNKHKNILLSVLDRAEKLSKATGAPVLLVAGGDVNRTPDEMVWVFFFFFSTVTFLFFSLFLERETTHSPKKSRLHPSTLFPLAGLPTTGPADQRAREPLVEPRAQGRPRRRRFHLQQQDHRRGPRDRPRLRRALPRRGADLGRGADGPAAQARPEVRLRPPRRRGAAQRGVAAERGRAPAAEVAAREAQRIGGFLLRGGAAEVGGAGLEGNAAEPVAQDHRRVLHGEVQGSPDGGLEVFEAARASLAAVGKGGVRETVGFFVFFFICFNSFGFYFFFPFFPFFVSVCFFARGVWRAREGGGEKSGCERVVFCSAFGVGEKREKV